MKVLKKIENILSVFISISFIGMLLVVLIQIFCRVTPLRSPAWTEEASRYFMVYLVALSSGLAIKHDAFVNVDTIFHYLNDKNKLRLSFVNNTILIVFFAIFFVSSFDFYNLGLPQNSVTMPFIPMNVIYFSMLLLSFQVVVFLLIEQCKIISKIKNVEMVKC